MANPKKIRRERRMKAKEMHQEALRLYTEGRTEEALMQMGAVLKEEANSERWNDWAAVQHALGFAEQAEIGFRKALELDRSNLEAAANLGSILVARGRPTEAAPFLLAALNTADASQRVAIQGLIAQISKLSGAAAPVPALAKT
jgi:Flp pilus assembly protein TadD